MALVAPAMVAAQLKRKPVSLAPQIGRAMKILRLALALSIALFLVMPNSALSQASEPLPLAEGETVQFSITFNDDYAGEWVGTVREVRNPRGCVFVVHSKILKGDIFSMGVRFSDDFVLTKHSSEGSITIDGATLRQHGIDCIETHPTAHPSYLTPAEGAEEG